MEEIVKVAENNVELRTYRLAKEGEKIYSSTKVYGQVRMEGELKNVDAEILALTNLDVLKDKANKLTALNAKRELLLGVKAKLEEKDGK